MVFLRERLQAVFGAAAPHGTAHGDGEAHAASRHTASATNGPSVASAAPGLNAVQRTAALLDGRRATRLRAFTPVRAANIARGDAHGSHLERLYYR